MVADCADVFVYSKLPRDCIEGVFGCNPDFFPENISLFPSKTDVKQADLVIMLCNYPNVTYVCKKRIERKSPCLSKYVKSLQDFATKYTCTTREGTYADCVAMRLAIVCGRNRFTMAELPAEIPIDPHPFTLNCKISEKEIRDKIDCELPYVTVQRGCQDSTTGTRCWSVWQYEKFIEKFKEDFPRVKFVQLGAGNCSEIKGVDVDLRGKTSFEELKAVLKFSVFHLDGECGMVHLKHVLGGRSVVLFGPTSRKFKGYAEDVNILSRPCGGSCEWFSKDWQNNCPFLELQEAGESACMKAITPAMVLAACHKNFGQKLC